MSQMKEEIRVGFYQPWYLPLLQKPHPYDHFNRHFKHPYDLMAEDEAREFWSQANEGHEIENEDTRRNAKTVVERLLGSNFASSGTFTLPDSIRDLRNRLGGRFVHVTRFAQEQEEVPQISADMLEKQEREEREKKLKESEEQLEKYSTALQNCDTQLEGEASRIRDLANRSVTSEQEKIRLQAEIKQKKLIVEMLKDPEGAMAELKRMNEKLLSKVRKLANDLEGVRTPLVEKFHQTVEKSRGTNSLAHQLVEDMKKVRKSMTDLIEEAKKKQTRLVQLRQELEGMDRSEERNKYVNKVNDIHITLTAQKRDVNNVCIDRYLYCF